METITSAQFVEPMLLRLKEEQEISNNKLLNAAEITDNEMHYLRGKIKAFYDAFTIITNVVEDFNKKYPAEAPIPADETIIKE